MTPCARHSSKSINIVWRSVHLHAMCPLTDVLSDLNRFFQEAMKDQQIEFKEIDTDHLGSEKEYKVPNSPGSSSSSSNKSSTKPSNSWRCWMCEWMNLTKKPINYRNLGALFLIQSLWIIRLWFNCRCDTFQWVDSGFHFLWIRPSWNASFSSHWPNWVIDKLVRINANKT